LAIAGRNADCRPVFVYPACVRHCESVPTFVGYGNHGACLSRRPDILTVNRRGQDLGCAGTYDGIRGKPGHIRNIKYPDRVLQDAVVHKHLHPINAGSIHHQDGILASRAPLVYTIEETRIQADGLALTQQYSVWERIKLHDEDVFNIIIAYTWKKIRILL
jgi:hypothetical protein